MKEMYRMISDLLNSLDIQDVYLSSPFACLDGGKRSQDTLSRPRILCGVDSINGRRRIKSTLVDGAKANSFKSPFRTPICFLHKISLLF